MNVSVAGFVGRRQYVTANYGLPTVLRRSTCPIFAVGGRAVNKPLPGRSGQRETDPGVSPFASAAGAAAAAASAAAVSCRQRGRSRLRPSDVALSPRLTAVVDVQPKLPVNVVEPTGTPVPAVRRSLLCTPATNK